MQSPSFEVKSKAVRAGAGAGKTHNLTHQVLDFAIEFKNRHQAWPRVLVTTFTRKATQELSERLIKLAMEKRPEALEFVTSSQYLGVSTIHGILDRFLKQWGHLISLQSDFGYIKSNEANHIAKKTLKALAENAGDYGPLFTTFSFSHLRDLLLESLEQDLTEWSAVNEHDLELLLAEHLMTLRSQLEAVLTQAKGVEATDKLKTIFSNLNLVLPYLSLSEWKDNREPAIKLIQSLNLTGVRVKPEAEIYSAYEDLKIVLKELRDLDDVAYDAATYGHLAQVNRYFQVLHDQFKKQLNDTKKNLNKIEISDLENYSLELSQRFPNATKAFSKDVDYWLIDEFQDTSPRQLEILQSLIGDKPYYLVGDPQQSIYLFRGARSEVFRDKVLQVQSSGGLLEVLDTNYRSTPSVLKLINVLSRELGSPFQSMKTAFTEATSSTELAAQFTVIEEQELSSAEQEQIEMENLYSQIEKLKKDKEPLEEIAILVRKNSQLEKMGRFLTAKGLPVHLHSSGLFWERREIQDAIALLKFLINPIDDVNLVKLLRTPFFAITDAQMAEVLRSRSSSVWLAFREKMAKGEFGSTCGHLVGFQQKTQQLGIVVAFQRALECLGFFDLHLKYDSTGRSEGNLWKLVHLLKVYEKERGANFVRFVNEAEKPEHMDRTIDAPGSVESNKINIMTVHASKGLQFNHVFLPFLGVNPYNPPTRTFAVDELNKKWCVRAPASEEEHKASGSLFEAKVIADFKIRQAEEDLRVFYVAYTRAKKQVFMSWSSALGEHSWAKKLKYFQRETGTYEEDGFVFSIQHLKDPSELTQVSERVEEPIAPPLWQGLRHQSWAPPDTQNQSVTRLLDSQLDQKKNYKNSFIKKTEGILFHKLLEIIKYPTEKDFAALVQDWFPGNEERIGEALNYALQLTEPPLLEIMKKGQVEWAFRTQKNNKNIEGQIDLWGVVDGQLWIVDYKSGEKILKDKAFQQLKMYTFAVQDFLKWTGPVNLAVIYPLLQESFVESIDPNELIF